MRAPQDILAVHDPVLYLRNVLAKAVDLGHKFIAVDLVIIRWD
jgi:hypothetical protein